MKSKKNNQILIDEVWTLLQHSGIEEEDFTLDVKSDFRTVLFNFESSREGSILISMNIKSAINLKKALDDAIENLFDEVEEIQQNYFHGGEDE